METTENYKLPQWAKADQIRMDDFNDAFGRIESALSGHDDALDGKADTSAVTAVQQEVAAAREANCLVKLAGPLVTTAANAAMEFDLSQVDMTKVAALLVVFSAGGSGGVMLNVNDTAIANLCSNNFFNSAGIGWLVPINGKISCFVSGSTESGTSLSGYSGTCMTIEWTAINKITINGKSNAGATATLFAVRK